jgi:predicted N-acetyltransferase YhbS
VRCQWPDVPDEAFMLLVLEPAPATRLTGVAHYRPEFDVAV